MTTEGRPISGSIELQTDGTYLVTVEVEGKTHTLRLTWNNPPSNGGDDMARFSALHPTEYMDWVEEAGGEQKVLSDIFQAHAEAVYGHIPASAAGLQIALAKVGSGADEARKIADQLPLT